MRTMVLLLLLTLGWTPLAQAVGEEAPAPGGNGASAEELALFEEGDGEAAAIADPIEPVNRGLFWVNDKLYVFLFKPVAKGWRAVAPEPARVCVGNFFTNLGAPVRFANDVLQLHPGAASDELARFVFNSTFGIAGLFDIAKSEGGVPPKEEDFGQTLGRYGAGHGFYLMLPVLGPSSLRDGVGRVGDYLLDPLNYLADGNVYLGGKIAERENFLSLDKDTYEGIKHDSLDPYLTIRNAYVQRRQAQVEK
jgi:phospholipid-binding lipoprotein MlaA